MKPATYIALLLFCIIIFGFSSIKKTHWVQLFNGKDLTGWDTYLGPDLDDHGKPITGVPLGLNNDPRHVFSIVKDSGENVIRISGDGWGAITSKKEYANYHLQLQFKWGEFTWGQQKGKKKDSGLLYHSVGKFGADYNAWMRSQEFQIQEGNCGDYWGCAGGEADVPAVKSGEADYIYNPQGELTAFSQANKQGRHCIKQGDAENPSGQWNTIDLYCHGDTSIHVVNGKVMMILYHNKQLDNGKELQLTKGKLQVQSEGAEVYYRHIQIEQIDRLPVELVKSE